MAIFKEITLGELIKDNKAYLQTGPFGTMLNASEYCLNGTPVIAVQDIGDNKLQHEKFVFVDNSIVERLARYKVKENDIIFSRKGAVERRAIIRKAESGWLQGSDCIRLRLDESINPQFVSYQLGDRYHKDWLTQFATGATMPSLNQDVLKLLPLFLPPLPEQQAIAEVLSSLDDKIDLLHRQNKTLEAIAETLFRQWFVEEAEESWEVISLYDIAEHIKENVIPAKNPLKPFKHYSLPAFDERKEPKIEIGKEILSNKYKAVSNSILISKLNPITPRVWALFGAIDEEETICSTEFQVVKPKNVSHFGFVYYFLKSFQVTGELAGSASGTSGSHQRVTPSDIFNLNLLHPPENKIEEFNEITQQSLKKLKDNKNQICKLIKIRDELLPRLMSGDEVRVKSGK